MPSGFFEIGMYHTKTPCNLGTLWRSAYQLGAAGLFTIGHRYRHQGSDTCKTFRHIPLRHYPDFADFLAHIPHEAHLIAVEMGGDSLRDFQHPRSAIYLLGAEDHGLPDHIIAQCHTHISLQSCAIPSYNVAVAGSIVMYDRVCTKQSVE